MKEEKIVRVTLDEIVRKGLSDEQIERLRKISMRPDSEIDYSDAPEITEDDITSEKCRVLGRGLTVFPHGGARAGAGRKPKNTKPILLRLPPATINRIRTLAKKEHKTLSAVVAERLACA